MKPTTGLRAHDPFRPDLYRDRLLAVTVEDLQLLGVSGILLDADNTSSYDGTTEPLPGTADWIGAMNEAGYPVFLLSNAKEKRALKMAGVYGIPYQSMSKKPSPKGFRSAAEKLGLSCSDLVMIGDQLHTDVWGGNRSGCRTIYVTPYARETRLVFWYPMVRFLEGIVLKLQRAADRWAARTVERRKHHETHGTE